MMGLCEVRCNDTNISSAIAAKPSRSTSSVNRSVLTRLPPSRDVVPEARWTIARWPREARGSGGLPPGPAESRRREAAARSDAAFGPAPAAWTGSPWMPTGNVSRPLLDDEIAQIVAADRLPGQDQRGCGGLLDHARPADPVQPAQVSPAEHGALGYAAVEVEVDRPRRRGRLAVTLAVVVPGDNRALRGCRGDPQRNDFQRRIQPEGIRFQAAALKGAAKLLGCPGVADRDLEGVFLAPVAKLGVPGHCRSLRVGAQVGQGGALRGREPLGQVGSGDR